MKLSFHGQSTIYLEGNNKKVIVDPFISNNPKCDLNIETVQVDYIVLTHGHFDHFGDVVELAKKTGATVIGSAEMADYLSSYHGVENVHGMNIAVKQTLISEALNLFKHFIVQVLHMKMVFQFI